MDTDEERKRQHEKLIAVLCAFGMCAGLITPQMIYAEEPAAAPAEKRTEETADVQASDIVHFEDPNWKS